MTGETILHYRIEGRLGKGGMGVVFRATDLRLLRTVALKFVPEEITMDAAARKRFLHEAQVASGIVHHIFVVQREGLVKKPSPRPRIQYGVNASRGPVLL